MPVETSTAHYRGRFAPSPTGPLHFGSLIAAVGSYLQAKQHDGEWLLRIEDIDPPREVEGATDSILFTLDHFGFEWDGPVLYQSSRSEAYLDALSQLDHEGLSYRCCCSRKQIAEQSTQLGLPPYVYPGTCRNTQHGGMTPASTRLLTRTEKICFTDLLQGDYCQQIEREVGDFVLRRADGLFAYQLAVVIDDAYQGITEIVRGSDLLDNTPRQIVLQQALGFDIPRYLHLPLVVNEDGQKLSKQTFAAALDDTQPTPALWQALKLLGQEPEKELIDERSETLWQWAVEHWQSEKIPRKLSLLLL